MRAFIAITLPISIKTILIRTTAAIRPRIKSGVRWTPPDNLHLTLRFLGESSPDQITQLIRTLPALAKIPPVRLSVTQYGVFPAWKSPSTVWLGFEPDETLALLQQHTETIVQECGFRAEKKPFRPHLTLARVKRNPSDTTINQIHETFHKQAPPPIAPFEACHVVLFQSILRPDGAVYEPLLTVELEQ